SFSRRARCEAGRGPREEIMKNVLLAATALAFGIVTTAAYAEGPAPWAYGFTAPPPPNMQPAGPNPQQPQDNVVKHTVPGSKSEFTRAQIANRYGPAD